MKYTVNETSILLRFDKGDLLVKNLTELVTNEDIRGAWLNGIGAAKWAELGYYNLDNKIYKWKKLDRLLEITSLQGNVSWCQGKPILHIHGTFADEEMRTYGGHLRELSVGGTCEVLLSKFSIREKLTRKRDDATGLTTLEL